MHILIGVLTSIAGLVWAFHALQNAGVDLNAFNPFTWMRRRQWEKKFGTKPMHALTDSMEVAALLVVSIAKEDGEITRDTKLEILAMFEKEFGVKKPRALELFSSSTYMLKDVMNVAAEVAKVLAPSKDQFQKTHVDSLVEMMRKTRDLEEGSLESKDTTILAVQKEFEGDAASQGKW